jgi:hypothetical protein
MARDADVPLAVTLDHGASRDTVIRALRAGCTGIMFDGSTLDLEENIRQTRDVVQLCRAVGVSVEGRSATSVSRPRVTRTCPAPRQKTRSVSFPRRVSTCWRS